VATGVTHEYSYVHETYTYTKRDIYLYQKRRIYIPKETCSLATGVTHEYLYVNETYTYTKRDINLYQKRHIQSGDRGTTCILCSDIYIDLTTDILTLCNTLQHAATHCNTLQNITTLHRHVHRFDHRHINTMQHTATRCNTLQHMTTLHRHLHRFDQWHVHSHCMCHDSLVCDMTHLYGTRPIQVWHDKFSIWPKTY